MVQPIDQPYGIRDCGIRDPAGNLIRIQKLSRTVQRRCVAMAEKKLANKSTKKSPTSVGFTAEERAAMKEHAAELKAAARGADGEKQVLGAIAKMPEPDRGMGKRLHELIRANAPALTPKTWYGMPAYANKDGKVVVFFRNASKFKERYAMLGFNEWANLDDGSMWPIAYALPTLTAADEKKIAALVKKAVR